MKFSPKLKITAFIVLLFLFLLSLNLTFLGNEVKNLLYLASFPIQEKLWRLGYNISDFLKFIFEMKTLKKENEKLELKLQELLAENAYLKELKNENEFLRESLNIGLEKEFELVLAKTTEKDFSSDLITINKGSDDGISEGMPVITQQKVLVGKINKVYRNFSKVMLISHKESLFPVKISETDILGVIKGRGNLDIFLDSVPQENEIKEGDLIITTALTEVFPEGLLVGEIEEVKKSDIDIYQKAEVKPFFDIKKIENLFVIISF